MYKGRIENWQEIKIYNRTAVRGNIFECEGFQDGSDIITSKIVEYRNEMGQAVLETKSGSIYHLGKPTLEADTVF